MSDLAAAKKALVEDDVTSPKVEALIEAMFLAANADGNVSEDEVAHFSATVEALTEKRFSASAVRGRVETLKGKLKTEGRAARLSSLAARLGAGKPRETALILAASITASDGNIAHSENDLLADLAEALEIPQATAVDLVGRIHGVRA